MLNELLIIERGARQAGIKMVLRHSEVKNAGRKPTLHVFLDDKGQVSRVQAIPLSRLRKQPLWKLGEGQKNSFPFVQPKPLWDDSAIRIWEDRFKKKSTDSEKRQTLLEIGSKARIRDEELGEWTSSGIIKALSQIRRDVAALEHSDAGVLPVTIDRFLLACDKSKGGNPANLVRKIVHKIIEELRYSSSTDLIVTAIALLIESGNKCGAFYFDAEGEFPLPLTDVRLEEMLCKHLRQNDFKNTKRVGTCCITGENGHLVSGNFSQPNLPFIQQSFLFAKNEAIPAMERYGQIAANSIDVGYMTDIRLRAAIEALCEDERKGKTWRGIPSEVPKVMDLLLAFVDMVPDAPMVEVLTEKDIQEEEDFSEETEVISETINSIAGFEKRTERLIDLVKAKVGNDITRIPVQLVIFRKVDQANRKVVYADTLTVSGLYQAATDWKKGERNVPEWLKLFALPPSESKPRLMSPPHVAPLGLIAFSKQIFLRSGERPGGKKKEQVGLPASEALRFFIDAVGDKNIGARNRAERILRLLLARRSSLLEKVAHIQHIPDCCDRRSDLMKKLDRYEALRSVTLMGILLHKLNREKEVYMNETAFKLGQLLAGADMVHAGYCADVRGGAVPPSLLGNQVFTMAQTTPIKALSMLCQRWKPYDGWAKKAVREANRIDKLVSSGNKTEQDRGWDIRNALSYAWRIRPLANDLAPALGNCRVDDIFRAELLLGYIAGLPKVEKENTDTQDNNQEQES